MKTICILCGIPLEEGEDFCENCLEFLKEKYPKKKDLEEALQWHKNHTQLNREC